MMCDFLYIIWLSAIWVEKTMWLRLWVMPKHLKDSWVFIEFSEYDFLPTIIEISGQSRKTQKYWKFWVFATVFFYLFKKENFWNYWLWVNITSRLLISRMEVAGGSLTNTWISIFSLKLMVPTEKIESHWFQGNKCYFLVSLFYKQKMNA